MTHRDTLKNKFSFISGNLRYNFINAMLMNVFIIYAVRILNENK